jgi:TrbL/VirB6 plasmid conjugal transfer protein
MPRLFILVAAVLLWLWAPHACAADAFPIGNTFDAIEKFGSGMNDSVTRALGTGAIRNVVNVLFAALAISLFVWKFVGYALRGFDVMDILELMLSIMFVYILLTGYAKIFPTISQGANYIGDALGSSIASTGSGVSFSRSILSNFDRMTFMPDCSGLDCLGKGFMALVATAFGWCTVVILGIAAILVELWTTWGFAIAYAIGWVTIPFMLYERLSFLFDGWVKFFFGMAVYSIVAKVNLALVYLSINLMMGSGTGVGVVEGGMTTYKISGLMDIAGLLVFVTVGIFSLFSTNRFAQAIVMGAGGGGIAGMVQSVAHAGAKAASGGAGAAAGAAKKGG